MVRDLIGTLEKFRSLLPLTFRKCLLGIGETLLRFFPELQPFRRNSRKGHFGVGRRGWIDRSD